MCEAMRILWNYTYKGTHILKQTLQGDFLPTQTDQAFLQTNIKNNQYLQIIHLVWKNIY